MIVQRPICRFFIACCFVFIFSSTQGQETKSDSLVQRFNSITDPCKKASLAFRISRISQGTNQVRALDYANKGLLFAMKCGNDTLVGDAMNVLGTVYYINGDFDQARKYYEKAIPFYKKARQKIGEATSINNVGLTYINQGRYSEGLKYQFESLAIYDSVGFEQGVSRTYNAIAVVYCELGSITHNADNYKNALVYLRKCLAMSSKAKDSTGYNNVLINIGNVYRSTGVFDSALYYYQAAEKMARKLSDQTAFTNSIGNIADVFLQQGKYQEAIAFGEQVLELKKNLGDQLGQASVEIILSQAYQKSGDTKKSFELLLDAYSLAEKVGAVNEQSQSARFLAQQQADRGNYFEAWKLLNVYANLSDSITQKENRQIIQELKRFTDEDQKKQIELLTQQSQIADLKSNRQSQMLMFSVIGFALLMIIALTIYSRFLVKKKANQNLQLAYSTIEEKNKSITDSIRYAKNLQEAILPSLDVIHRLLPDHFLIYLPKDIVAGDFYWVEEHEGLIYFAAADCTGHGVPGALVSVVCSKALQQAVFQFKCENPGAILDKATELVLETFDRHGNEVNDGMDISLACWNPQTRELKWAGAFNPVVIVQNGQLTTILPNKQPVGRAENRQAFTTHSFQVPEKTMLYLLTDGYQDQFGGEKGKKFKQKQLLELLDQVSDLNCPEQKKVLEDKFLSWKGEVEQVDDVLIFGIRV